jgi:hypothetical protein
MDNLNDVVQLVADCGFPTATIAVDIQIEHLPMWGMYIHNDTGRDYYLSTYENGGYILQARNIPLQALVTSGTFGIRNITRDPEEGICHIYLPVLDADTFKKSIGKLNQIIKSLSTLKSKPISNN